MIQNKTVVLPANMDDRVLLLPYSYLRYKMQIVGT